ncbi:MAG: PBSX family phage terminase large subunit, partial [Gammaproteobacteria bacterium]
MRIPKKLFCLLSPARYKVAYGGRGGAKSWSFARILLALASSKKLRILCARELQNSMQDSVHKLLSDQIESLSMQSLFVVQRNEIFSSCGSEFLFYGIRNNPAKIRSMEGIDIAWAEEADRISDESWEILIPTVRDEGSEIWISFNPHSKTDPVWKRFLENPPPGTTAVEMSWRDNPWLSATARAEKDYLARVDPEAYAHVWEGQFREHSAAQVLLGKYVIEGFEPDDTWDGPYYGADWGFAHDPTVLVRCWIHAQKLYIEHEAYGVGVELDETAGMFNAVPGGIDHIIRADSARPETISYLQRHGYPNIKSVEKWAGSVEDGVAFLRQFEQIVIHSRCKHTAEEALLWSYKTDSLTGDILPVLLDVHNHCMDA